MARSFEAGRNNLLLGLGYTRYHMRYSDELLPELPKPYKILPEMMREQGYYTGNIKSF